MKSITLRNIPPELARKLEERARANGTSLAQTVIKLLEESTGTRRRKRPVVHHDLDALAGTWSEEEGAIFEESLREQRKVDPDLWR